MIFWIILPFLFLQLSNAIKFTELKGNDLKGNKEVSFAKYENKCVLLLQLSPLIRSPPARVEELNKIYDKYNGQGKNSIFMKFLNFVPISNFSFFNLLIQRS